MCHYHIRTSRLCACALGIDGACDELGVNKCVEAKRAIEGLKQRVRGHTPQSGAWGEKKHDYGSWKCP